jgi:hypothetical protein
MLYARTESCQNGDFVGCTCMYENYSQTDDLRTAATEISGVVWRMEIRVVLLKKSVAESRTEAELFAHRRRLVSVL